MMKKWLGLLFVAALALTFPAGGFAYTNPIQMPESWHWDKGDFYGEGDPYILKFNGIYYLYTSTVDDKAGVKAWSSADLVHWEYRGLVTTELVTKAAYAPEVIYWNGQFYMYTSPAGRGHYVLKSDSPLGPFTVQTENKGMGIDGHVFIDDDGKWYFYSTGAGRINVRPMSDPYTFGALADTGAEMKGWTEGPTVVKRNGKYYMTYTGNHIWSKAYRVNYSSSISPMTGFTPASSQNPILINTEGNHVGLGHNSIVRGPDLDSDYMVYHNHASPGRNMNLDRIVWNGDKMIVLGPTTSTQTDPEMPDFSDRFQRAALGKEWKAVNGGNWGIRNEESLYQDRLGDPLRPYLITSKEETENQYTAEFHMKQVEQGKSANPLIGAVFSYKDKDNYGVAVLSRNHGTLETFFRVNGRDIGWEASPLPEDYDFTKWHEIRVEKGGSDYRIYVDGMLKQTRTIDRLGSGKVGYTTTDARADFGYVAFSNEVDGSSANQASKPIPGEIQAVHYNTDGKDSDDRSNESDKKNKQDQHRSKDIIPNPEGGYYVKLVGAGDSLRYNITVTEAGTYDLVIRYSTAAGNARLKLALDDSDLMENMQVPSTGGVDQWGNLHIKGLQLPKGQHILKLKADRGEFNFSALKFQRSADTKTISDDFNDGNDTGWKKFDQSWRIKTDEPSSFDAYKPIPGIVEAPYYNTGGEGVAYHDATAENIGGALRGDAVDIRTNSFNGINVGWNQTGEWLKYNVDVKEAGFYNFELSAATTFTGTQARLWLDEETDLTGIIDIPTSGNWNVWQTASSQRFFLPEGKHTLKLETVKGEFDFARLKFTSFDIYKPLPGIIEAVHYNTGGAEAGYHDNTQENIGGKYRADAVDIRVNPEGGWHVGWNQTGEWLKYNVDVAATGTYKVDARIATALDGGKIRLWLDDMTDLTDIVEIPNTGGWDTWNVVRLGDIVLPQGKHTIKVEIVEGEYDFSKLTFFAFDKPKSVPGTVYAAEYKTGGEGDGYHDLTPENIGSEYRDDAVDIRTHPEGGFTTGWNQSGEWLKYNVHIDEAGTYKLDLKVATALEGGKARLWLNDSIDLTGIMEVPNTGGFDAWSTLTKEGITLPEGDHTIKVDIVEGEFDFYSFRFHNDPAVLKQGMYKSEAGGFAKSVIGDGGWSDYTIEADIKLASGTSGPANSGILMRVNNPATGNDWGQNNGNFLQGYSAYLTADGVHLAKFNYNFEYLTGTALSDTVDTWQHMKVVVSGANIKIYVGDMNQPLIDYTDRSSTAYTHGKVGVRSFFAESLIDNFTVKPNSVVMKEHEDQF